MGNNRRSLIEFKECYRYLRCFYEEAQLAEWSVEYIKANDTTFQAAYTDIYGDSAPLHKGGGQAVPHQKLTRGVRIGPMQNKPDHHGVIVHQVIHCLDGLGSDDPEEEYKVGVKCIGFEYMRGLSRQKVIECYKRDWAPWLERFKRPWESLEEVADRMCKDYEKQFASIVDTWLAAHSP